MIDETIPVPLCAECGQPLYRNVSHGGRWEHIPEFAAEACGTPRLLTAASPGDPDGPYDAQKPPPSGS